MLTTILLSYIAGISLGLLFIYILNPESRDVVGPLSFIKFVLGENKQRYNTVFVVIMALVCWAGINYVCIPFLVIREFILNPRKAWSKVMKSK